MRIALKLTAGFVAIAALAGLVGYFSGTAGRQIQSQLEQLSRSAIVKVVDAANMLSALDACHRRVGRLVRSGSDSGRPQKTGGLVGQISEDLDQFHASLERSRMAGESLILWARNVGEPEVAQREQQTHVAVLDRLDKEFLAHRRLVRRLLEMAENDPDSAEKFLRTELLPHSDRELLPLIAQYRASAEKDFTRSVRTAERAMVRANERNSLLTIGAMVGAVGLGLLISRSIGRRLGRLETAALSVGRGDLDARVPPSGKDEISTLGEAFNRMVADLRERTVSKAYVDSVIRSMREMLIVTDSLRRIQSVNPATLAELGYQEEQLVGEPIETLFSTQPPPRSPDDSAGAEPDEGNECLLRTRDGKAIPAFCSISPLSDVQGRPQGFVCVALNIAQKKAAEERIRASLEEKDLLLREIHHRVKNNLQVISSLLSLQSQQVADPDVARLFRESQGRIRSMALIHEQLYRSGILGRVDFAEYLDYLTDQLTRTLDAPGRSVRVEVEADPILLPLDLAIPSGMIVNELVSNAMKHAFPDDRAGRIEVTFHRDEYGYVLTVADNGVGMPAEAPPEKSGALGMTVVEALVRQLDGTLKSEGRAGASFEIRFAGGAKEGTGATQPPRER